MTTCDCVMVSSQDEKLYLGVKEVLDDSPACRSLRVGDVIIMINDWKIQNIKQPEIAANLFKAAGNFVTLNIDRQILRKIHLQSNDL